MIYRFKVQKNERGFLFKGTDYVRYLRPGVHWVLGFGYRVELRRATPGWLDVGEHLDTILKDPAVWEDLAVYDLRGHERALVWSDGRLMGFGETKGAFWKTLSDVRVEVVDLRAARFEHDLLDTILAHKSAGTHLEAVVVPPGSVGLFVQNEKVREELGPGRYALFRGLGRQRIEVVDRREQTLEVTGQEVLTKDKATVRMNVAAAFAVKDVRAWLEVHDARSVLYRELQLAVRGAVGVRTLDELLAAKDSLGAELLGVVAPRAERLGASVSSVGVKDVILPGDMRTLLNSVIEAEKRAQANLITRREETAATRALLNTAKLYAEHPALLRLKELEVAEKVAEKVAELHVGGVDELLTRFLPAGKGA